MKTKYKNLILAIIVSVMAIFLPSLLFNKWIEGIVFFFCHWFIREQFPKQYHHIVPSMCRLITSVVFFFGVSFVLPLSWSLFSAIPINYFIGWIGFTKKQSDDYEVIRDRIQQEEDERKQLTLFDLEKCTKDELIARCKLVNLTGYSTDLAIDIFINKCSNSYLANKYCINKSSIAIQKMRIKKKLLLK